MLDKNDSEWWVTSKLTVEEWCGDSTKVRRWDLKILVSVKINDIKLKIPSSFQTKVPN